MGKSSGWRISHRVCHRCPRRGHLMGAGWLTFQMASASFGRVVNNRDEFLRPHAFGSVKRRCGMKRAGSIYWVIIKFGGSQLARPKQLPLPKHGTTRSVESSLDMMDYRYGHVIEVSPLMSSQ